MTQSTRPLLLPWTADYQIGPNGRTNTASHLLVRPLTRLSLTMAIQGDGKSVYLQMTPGAAMVLSERLRAAALASGTDSTDREIMTAALEMLIGALLERAPESPDLERARNLRNLLGELAVPIR